MKIGFVIDDGLDSTDGVQQYVLTLGKWLKKKGHSVHYLVGQTKREDLENVHSLSRIIRVSANQNKVGTPLPAKKSDIKRLLEKEKFDVLHVQMPYSPLLAGKIINCAPTRTAIIGTFHILPSSKLEHAATKLLGKSLKKSLSRFDQVVSVSEPAAKFAKTTFGVKSQVIPNAVELSGFKSAKILKKYKNEKLKIVYLGRLVKRKGCDYLLDALGVLKKSNRLENVQVAILGKGKLEKKLKAKSKKLGLEDIVEFVGFVDEKDKPDYLASADIAVFPSIGGESFGIVLVEAMAAGADVVVAGNNPGYASVLQTLPEQLANPKKTTHFARMLEKYLANRALRIESRHKQGEIVEQFDVNVVGKKILEIYKNNLAKK